MPHPGKSGVIFLAQKRFAWDKIIWWFVFVSMLASVLYSIVMIILAPSGNAISGTQAETKIDFVLVLLQCIFGVLCMLLPRFLEHKLDLVFPPAMLIMYSVFLFCAAILGEFGNFFYIFPLWDDVLHAFSCGVLTVIGFSVFQLLKNSNSALQDLNPSLVAMFAFSFTVVMGVAWEVYEYIFDGLLGINMQKFILANGTVLAGHAALSDTMHDLIVNGLASFAVAAFGYISLKFKMGWIEKLLLVRKKDK
jgi:hypothetical protein